MVCENYLNIIIILLLYNAIKFDYLYKIIFDITNGDWGFGKWDLGIWEGG